MSINQYLFILIFFSSLYSNETLESEHIQPPVLQVGTEENSLKVLMH